MHARKLVVGTIAGAAAFGALVGTGGAATSSAPKFTKAPVLTYQSTKDRKGRYITVGAFLRLDRTFTDKLRRKYFLVAGTSLRSGQTLPRELFGGGSLGKLGKSSRHCYGEANVALLKRKKSTSNGTTWGIGFASGKKVVGKVWKVKIKRSTESSVVNAADKLGCGGG
jgi:hypothetical protein